MAQSCKMFPVLPGFIGREFCVIVHDVFIRLEQMVLISKYVRTFMFALEW